MTNRMALAEVIQFIRETFTESELTAVHLHFVEGRTHDELAEVLSLSGAKEAEQLIRRLNARSPVYSRGMTEPTSQPQEHRSNIQIVEGLFDAFKAFDLPRALTYLSDDVVYQNVPLPADRGKQQAERTLRKFMRLANEFDVQMHNIAERGNVVLTERTDIFRGRFMDLEFWVCGTFEVHDGKITLWRDYADSTNVLLQLLISPVRKLFKQASHGASETA